MHIEFLDMLRCPQSHEETWLVAALNRMDGRFVLEAKLGCPVCGAQYFIRDGVPIFDGDDDSRAVEDDASRGAGCSATPGPVQSQSFATPSADSIAAFLDLTRLGSTALLAGTLAEPGDLVAQLTGAKIIALNGAVSPPLNERVAYIRARKSIPLAARSLDGVALDELHSSAAMLEEAARLLRPRGRLVASARSNPPPHFTELARDANLVVAEYVGDLVSLRR